ncbi:MAG: hypothetical protein ACRYG7_14140 [Janthinobacterium lividum]
MPAAPSPDEHLPPPAEVLPTLLINAAKRRAYLSQGLVARLGLRPGQPIDLRPPAPGSSYWYLDLRPRCQRRVDWYADTRPRIQGLQLPSGLLSAGQTLTLQLQPGEPEFPNYYPLKPCA